MSPSYEHIKFFYALEAVYLTNLQLVPQDVAALDEQGPDDSDSCKKHDRPAVGYYNISMIASSTCGPERPYP